LFCTCSRVPDEYVPQHPTNGNPPTLILALSGILFLKEGNKYDILLAKPNSFEQSESYTFLETV
jgi:hypothetical protein